MPGKLLAAMIVFSVTASSAFAQWYKFQDSDAKGGVTLYVDPRGAKSGDLATFTYLQDFRQAQETDSGSKYLSMQLVREFECKTHQTRMIEGTLYAGGKAAGEQVSQLPPDVGMKPVIQGTPMAALFKWVCGTD
jgi:hypothetical protein